MLFLIIGAVVGFVLTLSGCGGAILAIPMMVHWGHLSLVHATILSLPIVGVSALVPLLLGVWRPNWGVLTVVVMGAIPSSFAMAFVKPYISGIWILMALIGLSVWAVYHVWIPEFQLSTMDRLDSFGRRILIGVMAGLLTTLTGLGGGVVLIPLLRRFLGMPLSHATATSLGIILVIATSSFLMQLSVISPELSFKIFIFLFFGVLVANGIARVLLRRCSDHGRIMIRKGIISLVVVFSLALLFF